MRVHVLQHVPFEGLASIESWLADRAADVTFTRWFESAELPPPESIDLVIALGGPMSAADELDWLSAERRFLAQAIEAEKAVLGICLGAQLIARALGAEIRPSPEREIGWFPVETVQRYSDSFPFPESFVAFHWHGETFELPRGSRHLLRSAGCPHQAYQYGSRTLGLQFHLETTPAAVAALLAHGEADLKPGRFVQTEQALRAVPPAEYESNHRLMQRLLDWLVRR